MTYHERPYGDLVESTLRVMTWNVRGRFGPWEKREAAILRQIIETAPDIIALQECWFDDAGHDQAALLAEALRMHHCLGGGDPLDGSWGTANAILSR